MEKKGIKILIISVSCVLAVLIAGVVALNAILPSENKIASGVSLAGTDVSDMTAEEVEEVFVQSDYYKGKSIVFIGEPDTEEISGEHIGLSVDAKASAEKAYNICREGSWFGNVIAAVKLRFSPIDISPVPAANEMLDEVIYNRGVRKNGEFQELVLEEMSDREIHITPQVAGQKKDVSKSREEVLRQIENGNTDEIFLELPVSETETITAEELYEMIYIEPVNAEYKIENKQMHITPEVVGRSADMAEIQEKIEILNGGERIILAISKVLPEITAESLNKELFEAELASYSSKYSTSAANRSFNVSRAAASVNGIILMPGDVFSYNDAIGNPSLANGYKVASVYENGRQTEGVGGGVCQVSSTIYCAALYANLEIVERRSHSLTVAYVPNGQDATVSYGVLDFKFRNSTQNPIKIEATAMGGVCKVRILGAKPANEQKVQIVNTTVAVNKPTTNETLDPSLPEGTRKVTSNGKTGYVVDSVRIVTENGKEVKREQLTRSTYKSVPTEVTVGTKVAATPVPTPENVPASTPAVAEPTVTPEPTTVPVAEPTEKPTEPIVIPTEEPAEPVTVATEEPKEEV
ncbi:MAG: VanW family protein [Clostridia bacterium]|nr:VanW family protein [Clostridia bacterium]